MKCRCKKWGNISKKEKLTVENPFSGKNACSPSNMWLF